MRAMDNPYFNILGHATGRLSCSGRAMQPDMEKARSSMRKPAVAFLKSIPAQTGSTSPTSTPGWQKMPASRLPSIPTRIASANYDSSRPASTRPDGAGWSQATCSIRFPRQTQGLAAAMKRFQIACATMSKKQNDLYGNVPDKSPVALLLIDVINDLDFPEADALRRTPLPMAKKLAALKALG